jgi:hypothetical protein
MKKARSRSGKLGDGAQDKPNETRLPLVMAHEILTTPAHCRLRAAECERLATTPAMASHRDEFLSIAAKWRKIADYIEAAARRS